MYVLFFFVTCVELSVLLKDHRKSQVCAVCIAYYTYPHFQSLILSCCQNLHSQSLVLLTRKSEVGVGLEFSWILRFQLAALLFCPVL